VACPSDSVYSATSAIYVPVLRTLPRRIGGRRRCCTGGHPVQLCDANIPILETWFFRAAVFELHISRIVQQAKSVYLVKTYRNTLTLHKLLLMWLKGYLILFRFLVVKLNFGFTSTETQRMMLHLWDIFFILREVLRAVIARLFCSFIDYHCI